MAGAARVCWAGPWRGRQRRQRPSAGPHGGDPPRQRL